MMLMLQQYHQPQQNPQIAFIEDQQQQQPRQHIGGTLENISFALSTVGPPIALQPEETKIKFETDEIDQDEKEQNNNTNMSYFNSYNSNSATNVIVGAEIQNNKTTENNVRRIGSFANYGSFTNYGASVQYVNSEAGSFRVPPNSNQQQQQQQQWFFASQNQNLFMSGRGSAVGGDETPPVLALSSGRATRTNTITAAGTTNQGGFSPLQIQNTNPMNSSGTTALVPVHSNVSAHTTTYHHQQNPTPRNHHHHHHHHHHHGPAGLMRHMRTASGVEKLSTFERRWFASPFTASEMLLERLHNIISVLGTMREQYHHLHHHESTTSGSASSPTSPEFGENVAPSLFSASSSFSVLVALDEDELVGHVTDEIDAINSFASAAGRIAMGPVRDCFMRADKALSNAEKKVARAVHKMEKKKRNSQN